MSSNEELDRLLTPKDILEEIRDIGLKLIRLLNKHKITYFLTLGTLLGVVRYQNLMPWESDFDINIFDETFIFSSCFKKFLKQVKITTHKRKDSLVYNLCKNKIIYKSNNFVRCRMPSFDICILNIDKNGNYEIKNNKKNNYIDNFLYKDIFPLKKTKLMDVEVLIPNKSKKILELMYPDYQNTIVIDNIITKNNKNKNILQKIERQIFIKGDEGFKYLNSLAEKGWQN